MDAKTSPVVVRPETVRMKANFPQGTIGIRPHLWLKWAKIAIRQERRAWEARRTGLTIDNFAPWLAKETEESIETVAAARHCIHNLWLGWQPSLELSEEKEVRVHHITVDIPSDRGEWSRRLTVLIGDRIEAVHHEEETVAPQPHRCYPTNVAGVDAVFTAERGSEAVDVIMDIFQRVLVTPAARLERWASDNRHVLVLLQQQRTSGDDLW